MLRMRPLGEPDAERVLDRSARTASALRKVGAPVPGAVPSTGGRRVERVAGYAVTAMEVARGDTLDGDDLDPDTAHRWGALLGDLHEAGRRARLDDLPQDPMDAPASLPRDRQRYGLLHGDPELDNVVWTGDGGVFVDLDDVRRGWYVADVAFALRDWAPPAGSPDLTLPVPAAFLEGYRSRRPLAKEELTVMPLLAKRAAHETLARLGRVLAERPTADWPEWAHHLHERVARRADDIRRGLA